MFHVYWSPRLQYTSLHHVRHHYDSPMAQGWFSVFHNNLSYHQQSSPMSSSILNDIFHVCHSTIKTIAHRQAYEHMYMYNFTHSRCNRQFNQIQYRLRLFAKNIHKTASSILIRGQVQSHWTICTHRLFRWWIIHWPIQHRTESQFGSAGSSSTAQRHR